VSSSGRQYCQYKPRDLGKHAFTYPRKTKPPFSVRLFAAFTMTTAITAADVAPVATGSGGGCGGSGSCCARRAASYTAPVCEGGSGRGAVVRAATTTVTAVSVVISHTGLRQFSDLAPFLESINNHKKTIGMMMTAIITHRFPTINGDKRTHPPHCCRFFNNNKILFEKISAINWFSVFENMT